MASAAGQNSLLAIAQYLLALRGQLQGAMAARQEWVRRIGTLLEDARHGSPAQVASGAGALGRDYGRRFREQRSLINSIAPPPPCARCHAAVTGWLDRLIETCDLLERVGRTGVLKDLHGAQTLFAESRRHARAFNVEYARLADELRRATEARRVAAPGAAGRPGPRPAR